MELAAACLQGVLRDLASEGRGAAYEAAAQQLDCLEVKDEQIAALERLFELDNGDFSEDA